MKLLKATLGPYWAWVKLALLVFVVLKLWPLLSSIFGSFTKPLVDITTQVKAEAEEANDKTLVKKVNPNATDADIAVFKEDARTIALALGYLPGSWSNFIFADAQTAFTTAKKYSRYLMNGADARKDSAGKWLIRKPELRLAVLQPLYSDITGGRTLIPDLTSCFAGQISSTYIDLFNKFIK